jgi:hypothetical protein
VARPSRVVADVRADVVVLTALDLEYAAVRAYLTGLHTHTDANGTRYETGQFRAGRARVAVGLTKARWKIPRRSVHKPPAHGTSHRLRRGKTSSHK